MKKVKILGFVFFLGVFLFSSWNLFGIYRNYEEGEALYKDIEQEVVTLLPTLAPEQAEISQKEEEDKDEGKEKKKQKKDPMISVDFSKLKKINPEIVGWVYIPNSEISYPLLQGTDNDKYLHYTYDMQKSVFGSIFVDYRNAADFSQPYTLIYGHNMKNGSMFGTLKKYNEAKFFKEHRNIYILNEKGTFQYRVFSYHVADANGRIYTTDIVDEEDFAQHLRLITQSSYVTPDVDVTTKDKVITLSTCTGSEETRFAVHGVYVGKYKEK